LGKNGQKKFRGGKKNVKFLPENCKTVAGLSRNECKVMSGLKQKCKVMAGRSRE
jgi:hypothetical protein